MFVRALPRKSSPAVASRVRSMSSQQPERALQGGEIARIRRIVRRVAGRRSDADDILQEVLIEVVYRPPPQWQNLDAWVRKVAQNLAARRSRGERARARRERLVARERREPTPPELFDSLCRDASLRERIEALGPRYASVLRMRYIDELAIAEIARRLGRREGTIRAQIKRALERLRHGVRARKAKPARALAPGDRDSAAAARGPEEPP